MNWQEKLISLGLGLKYKEASFNNEKTILPRKLLDFGKNWVGKKDKQNLVLYGEPGRGKTWFMYCLMNEIHRYHENDYRQPGVYFFKSKTLDDRIISEMREWGSANDLINNKICGCDVLFLDDMGMERSSERAERDMFEIVDTRGNNLRPTVISTNLNSQQIEESFGSRISSRLKEYTWIKFQGKDLREVNEMVF